MYQTDLQRLFNFAEGFKFFSSVVYVHMLAFISILFCNSLTIILMQDDYDKFTGGKIYLRTDI